MEALHLVYGSLMGLICGYQMSALWRGQYKNNKANEVAIFVSCLVLVFGYILIIV